MVADSQTAVLQCEVANPSAEGKWLKDSQPVDFNENVLSEVDGAVRRLVIIITKATDIGEYTYQVATSKTSANLKVEGRSSFHHGNTHVDHTANADQEVRKLNLFVKVLKVFL